MKKLWGIVLLLNLIAVFLFYSQLPASASFISIEQAKLVAENWIGILPATA
ncbi:MAG: hypothetical protein LBT65_05160 [Synergistaceae bacterium]|jgi:hypothetical protein|nr:hypothetical protein [Synergistaceae bacterium]